MMVFFVPAYVSGALAMPLRRFALWNAIAGSLWVLAAGLGAYGLGSAASGGSLLHSVPALLVAAVASALLVVAFVRWRQAPIPAGGPYAAPVTRLARQFAAARADPGLVVLEGFHALKHALRFGAEVAAAADRPSRSSSGSPPSWRRTSPSRSRARRRARRARRCSVGAGRTHEVVAVARRPPFDARIAAAAGAAPVVLLEDPRHLGNVGAVVRVAAAAGAAGVVTTGPRDPWDPAALRGSAGLHFALPVGRADPDALVGAPARRARPRRASRWTRCPPTRCSRSGPSATGSATRCSRAPTPACGSRCGRASRA